MEPENTEIEPGDCIDNKKRIWRSRQEVMVLR